MAKEKGDANAQRTHADTGFWMLDFLRDAAFHPASSIWEDRASESLFFLISFQIVSSSASSTSPSRLPCARSLSSSRLNRVTNLSVAVCRVLSASSLHLRARLTTANNKSPISSSISSHGLLGREASAGC